MERRYILEHLKQSKKRTKDLFKKDVKESTFQHKLIKMLRKIPKSSFIVKEAKAIRGIPDIIGCIDGTYVALEVKKNKGEAQKNTGRICLQKKFIRDIQCVGGYASFIYPENHEEILEELWNLVVN